MRMVDGNGPWGKHLLIDVKGYKCPRLTQDYVAKFFDVLIEKLQMTKLGPFLVEELDEELNKGVSAVQMITTSSICLHEDAIAKAIYLDVFSCREFDDYLVKMLVQGWFKPTGWTSQVILRD